MKKLFLMALLAFVFALSQPAIAQHSRECDALMETITDAVDRVAKVSERMGTVEERIKHGEAVEQNNRNLETEKGIIGKDKQTINKLLAKLCACCAKGESKRTTQPTPTPGQATSDTLKKVFESVHIGIGIGGGYTSGHDEHRHRTADKVSTDKTKTHTTSPTTTHKTVTSACKCHPCTCSPCTCH